MRKVIVNSGLLTVVLATHAFLLFGNARKTSPILDEPAHLATGLAHWKTGDMSWYEVNPPLVRLLAMCPLWFPADRLEQPTINRQTTEAERPEFLLGWKLLSANDDREFRNGLVIARIATIVFALIGGVVCWLWARQLYGAIAGWAALGLWAYCPFVLGWGATTYPDIPAASMMAFASFLLWNWHVRRTWPTALAAGVALGFALLTKLTALVLVPVSILLILVAMFTRRDHGISLIGWQFGSIFLLAGLILNAGYGFEGSLKPLRDVDFRSKMLAGREMRIWQRGNRFADHWLGELPIPVPESFLMGIDIQRKDFEEPRWSYLNGIHKKGGWYTYYLWALLLKLPMAVLVLIVMRFLSIVTSYKKWQLLKDLWLMLPAISVLLLVSSQTALNSYPRYMFPLLPYLYIWLSGCVSTSNPRLWIRGATIMLVLVAAAESLIVYPHSISFFNCLFGGPARGGQVLTDSAIACGQDMYLFRDWLNDLRSKRLLYFASNGLIRPDYFGIAYIAPPKRSPTKDFIVLPPGVYAISTDYVYGLCRPGGVDRSLTYFQKLDPIFPCGYSMHVYVIEKELRIEFGD